MKLQPLDPQSVEQASLTSYSIWGTFSEHFAVAFIDYVQRTNVHLPFLDCIKRSGALLCFRLVFHETAFAPVTLHCLLRASWESPGLFYWQLIRTNLLHNTLSCVHVLGIRVGCGVLFYWCLLFWVFFVCLLWFGIFLVLFFFGKLLREVQSVKEAAFTWA